MYFPNSKEPKMNGKLIACCGINCATCDACIATMTHVRSCVPKLPKNGVWNITQVILLLKHFIVPVAVRQELNLRIVNFAKFATVWNRRDLKPVESVISWRTALSWVMYWKFYPKRLTILNRWTDCSKCRVKHWKNNQCRFHSISETASCFFTT